LAVTANSVGEVTVANINNVDYSNIQSSSDYQIASEKYNSFLLLSSSVSKNYIGSPVVNLAGDVVGIISQTQTGTQAVPTSQFNQLISNVLKTNSVKRPYLGVTYIDLAKVVGLDAAVTQSQTRGALVYQTPVKASPAGQAGILKNDIITKVNDQAVDQDNSLTDLVQRYQVGNKITLEILRARKTIQVEAALSVLP
jgi:serine protease Do